MTELANAGVNHVGNTTIASVQKQDDGTLLLTGTLPVRCEYRTSPSSVDIFTDHPLSARSQIPMAMNTTDLIV